MTQSDPSVPKRISGNFTRVRIDLAVSVQRLPEMSEQELLAANHSVGGFSWMDDPGEDCYDKYL